MYFLVRGSSLIPSQCSQAFRRDQYRLRGTLLRCPRLRFPFRFQKAPVMILRLLALPTQL